MATKLLELLLRTELVDRLLIRLLISLSAIAELLAIAVDLLAIAKSSVLLEADVRLRSVDSTLGGTVDRLRGAIDRLMTVAVALSLIRSTSEGASGEASDGGRFHILL